MNRREREDLDRYITGNWGEDSVDDDDQSAAEAHQASLEYQEMLEGALIEARNKGLDAENLAMLCSGCGIPYSRIERK